MANGVDKKKASEVFDLLEKFANYGFNKSHAAAYAVVSYQTAWLKANHPVEFMAGVMNCDSHLTDKLSTYAEEVRRGLGIEIVPPCVNRSEAGFTVQDGKLVYALGALKNVGMEAMRMITTARRDDTGRDKPFVTVYDFARRVDLKRVGKRPLEMLARAGAFDMLDANRRRVFEGLDALVSYSAAIHEQKGSNQVSLFGEAGDDLPEPRLMPVADWQPTERLDEEHKAIGFYLSGHPLDDYLPALKRRNVMTLAELQAKAEQSGGAIGKVGVLVSALQERKSGRGTRFFRMNISDPTSQVSGIAMFCDDFDAARRVFDQTHQVVMTLEARFNEGQFDPVGRSVIPMDGVVAEAGATGLRIFVENVGAIATIASVLAQAAEAQRNMPRGPVMLCLMDPSLPGETEIDTGQEFPLNPQIKGAIRSLPGVLEVQEV
jgi:DNA polymerase-3 subunit alpha